MAEWQVTTANASLEFDTTQGHFSSCYQIDSNHFINFWAGVDNDGFVQVFVVNTSTWAVATAADRIEFDVVNGLRNECYQIDSSHFINFWAGADNDGFVQVFTVNTSTWAVTTANAALEFDTTQGYYNSCYQIDSNHFINFWAGSGDDGFVQVFTVNTSTWAVTTANASLEFDTTYGAHNSCYQIDSNHFINFWTGNGTDGFVQVFTVNTSTWAVTTANASLEFDTNNGTFNSCYQIDSNHFINFWTGLDNDGYVQVFAVNTSTWAVTTANSALEFDTISAYYSSCYQIDSNHFINFWAGVDSDGYAQVFTVNTSTWAVTTANASLEFDTNNGIYHSCFQIDSNHFINFWTGVDTDAGSTYDGFVQVFTVELPEGGGEPELSEIVGSTGLSFTNAAVLRGSGKLVGASSLGFTDTAVLRGSGKLVGASALAFTDAAILKGTGNIQGASTLTHTTAAIIRGAGKLEGVSTISFTDAAVLRGNGKLEGLSGLTFSDAGILSGVGTLSGITSITFTGAGILSGVGKLEGASGLTFSDAATLRGAGALSGVTTITFTNDGVLSVLSILAQIIGASSLTFSTNAELRGSGKLVGATGLTFSDLGVIRGVGNMIGVTTITFTDSGTLRGTGQLYGFIDIQTSTSAILRGLGNVSGLSIISFSTAAQIRAIVQMMGSTGITFSTSGTLIGVGNMSGISWMRFTTAGELENWVTEWFNAHSELLMVFDGDSAMLFTQSGDSELLDAQSGVSGMLNEITANSPINVRINSRSNIN